MSTSNTSNNGPSGISRKKVAQVLVKKLEKSFGFFLSHFCRVAKYKTIFIQDNVKLSCRCYDTTLVALGNGL